MRKKKITRTPKQRLCEVHRVLTVAEELLTPKSWAKGYLRRNIQDAEKVQMCAVGAVMQAGEIELKLPNWKDVRHEAVKELDAICFGSSIIYFNDGVASNVEEVKSKFRAAIANVEAKIKALPS